MSSSPRTIAAARRVIAALIGAHLYLITKLGISAPPWLKAETDRELELDKTEV